MKNISIYAYGRKTVNGAWWINQNHIVNRLYYVNSGTALISNSSFEFELTAGKIYIIPGCRTFCPLNAWNFNHTFFDFFHSRIFQTNKIIEIDEVITKSKSFFDYINFQIENDKEMKIREAMEPLLSGYFSLLEKQGFELPFITNEIIIKALQHIHTEPADVCTRSLAQRLNIDESYFIRLFSSVVELTPMKYIRAYRVSKAKELIQNGESVAEAAEKCGYASPSSFYNAVKAELNMSPSELKTNN
ncbi:MAG: helix-turn-helix transcriptional regulator [Clostridia bacterium]|nr:helix-turn-helix transcriptional regulator [Clostridia bacterium]